MPRKRPVHEGPEEENVRAFGGDPFDMPAFYTVPRTPTTEPAMPNEVYYNKLTQDDEEGLTVPEGSPRLF